MVWNLPEKLTKLKEAKEKKKKVTNQLAEKKAGPQKEKLKRKKKLGLILRLTQVQRRKKGKQNG